MISDMRNSKKFWKPTDTRSGSHKAEAAISLSGSLTVRRSPFPSTNPSKRLMSRWSKKLWKAREPEMKKLEEYMALPYRMELIPDKEEGGFVVSFPDLPGCLTSGETPEAALNNAVDAKREWFLAAMEEGVEIPEPDALEDCSGQFNHVPAQAARSTGKTGRSQHQSVLPLSSQQRVTASRIPGV